MHCQWTHVFSFTWCEINQTHKHKNHRQFLLLQKISRAQTWRKTPDIWSWISWNWNVVFLLPFKPPSGETRHLSPTPSSDVPLLTWSRWTAERWVLRRRRSTGCSCWEKQVKAQTSANMSTFSSRLMTRGHDPGGFPSKGYTVGLKFLSRKKEAMMTRTRKSVLL